MNKPHMSECIAARLVLVLFTTASTMSILPISTVIVSLFPTWLYSLKCK